MEKLCEVAAQFAIDLSTPRLRSLVQRLFKASDASLIEAIKDELEPNLNEKLFKKLRNELKRFPELTSRELALTLQGASASIRLQEERAGTFDLVWTGPETTLIPVRQTAQALCELIEEAKKRLFIVSFVAYKADQIVDAIRKAIDRGVAVRFLVADTTSMDSIGNLKKTLPDVAYYVWKPSTKGSVHAKCAVADDFMALITSANLTENAMEFNMELGVLIRGGAIPKKVAAHFEALIDEKKIVELGSAK